VATVAWGEGADGVARAGDDAVQVLRLVTGLGRPPGLYRLDDVLLEAALSGTAAGPAARLASILAPLEGTGDLLGTLDAYLAADADRRRAAAALNVHPNTLDYRLRRIGELTGRSPLTARGLQVLGAALTLRRVTGTVSTRYS
jgi:DNA-binding PucR family transcriptional regulator